MKQMLKKLQQSHRRLNRLIDNTLNPAQQDEMKTLKRLRLLLKDKISQLLRSQRSIAP